MKTVLFPRSVDLFCTSIREIVRLRAGKEVRGFILGSPTPLVVAGPEPWLIAAAVALAGMSQGLQSLQPTARLTLVAIGCYMSICIALALLPRAIWVHHWVLGTPFQYVAIGLGLQTITRRPCISTATRLVDRALRLLVGVCSSPVLLASSPWRKHCGVGRGSNRIIFVGDRHLAWKRPTLGSCTR